MELIRGYIWDLDRLMEQLSQGNFNAKTSTTFIGDFRSIESFMAATISSICLPLMVTCSPVMRAFSWASAAVFTFWPSRPPAGAAGSSPRCPPP